MCRWLEEQEAYFKRLDKRLQRVEKRKRNKELLERAAERAKLAAKKSREYFEEEKLERQEKAMEMEFIASNYPASRFYNTPEWKQLRYRAIRIMGNTCMLCGASPKTGAVIQVDHILPRSIYPELALKIDNLQILCKDCNIGKSNKDTADFRAKK